DLVAAVRLLVVQIRLVLKRIGLQIACIERGVRNHIVGELDDLDVEAFLGRNRLDSLQDLRVRSWRYADLDGFGAGWTCDGCGYNKRGQEKTEGHDHSILF